MCFFGGGWWGGQGWGGDKPSPMSGYLVLKLPGWLQGLHGQEVVHEVHVSGRLQEWSLRVDSREARQQLLQVFQNLRAGRR